MHETEEEQKTIAFESTENTGPNCGHGAWMGRDVQLMSPLRMTSSRGNDTVDRGKVGNRYMTI